MGKLSTALVAAIVSIIAAYATVKFTVPAGTSIATQQESVFDRVMRTGTIKCGYVVYAPAVLKDTATGQLTGFAYDIVNQLAKNLGLKVAWSEEVNPGTMLEGLQTNRYDMICTPFWRNSERARVADFSDPFYYSAMGAWVRTDDHRFDDNLQAMNSPDVTLSILDGTTLAVVADQDFPQAKRLSLPQGAPLSDLLLNVASRKADAITIDNYLAEDFAANNPGSLRDVTKGRPIRVYPNGFVFNKNQYAFKAMLDAALVEMLYSGEIDRIISRYEKYPGTFYRFVPPYRKP